MIFSIYVHRGSPELLIFDRQVGRPTVGRSCHYDCAGVFEVQDRAAEFYWRDDGRECYALGVINRWRLGPSAILRESSTGRASDKAANITRLWIGRPSDSIQG